MGGGVVFFGFLLFFPANLILSNNGAKLWIVQFPAGGVIVKGTFRMLFGHIGYVSLCHLDIPKSRSKYSAIALRVQPDFKRSLGQGFF